MAVSEKALWKSEVESEVEELVGMEKAKYCIWQEDRGKGQKVNSRSKDKEGKV